ncbi:MAG: TonB-dependent receptor [Sphingomonadales bacterium]|jgi:iron complex outermembrane receptor protein
MWTGKKQYRVAVLMGSALSVVAIDANVSAFAQEQDVQDQDVGVVEEILVTGSRIRRDPLSSPAPVTALDRDDIQSTGLSSIGDLLQRLPQAGSALNTKFNSSGNFGFSPDGGGVGAGATEIALRHLESKRTLVIVDGIRWVPGNSATGIPVAVDLNSIPTSMIERVEVLQDGASAIYGSDAIGGVVNVITRKNFEGIELNAQVGEYIDEGDGETYDFSGIWGKKMGDTHFVLSASYVKQKRVSAADRPISAFPVPFSGTCEAGGCSSGTPQGRFIFFSGTGEFANVTLNDGVLNDGMSNIPQFDPDNPGSLDFHDFTNVDRFNYQGFNLVLTPNERVNIFGSIEHDINESVKFYIRGAYNERDSKNQAAPEPIFIGPGTGSGGFPDTIGIDATNPFNPFGITLDADPVNGNFILLGRRPLELGPRIFAQDIETWYVGSGFEGQFELSNGKEIFWDVNFAAAENRGNQTKFGAINIARVARALGPIDECTGECVPLNLFGGQGPNGEGSITPEMAEYIGFTQRDRSGQDFLDFTINVSGDLFDLPAGAVGAAVGFEYRDQDGFFDPDPVVVAGESNGIPAQPTQGGFNVSEFYGEIDIPLLADMPGADLLEVNAAFRISDYNTSGSKTTYKAGVRYRPFADFLVRGTISTGIRAPGIGELFGTAASFDETINDPCSDMLALAGTDGGGRDVAQSAAIIAACEAQGTPSDGSYVQPNPQIRITTGGNSDLENETSDNYLIGGVYSPQWFEDQGYGNMSIEIDWYRIEVDGAIRARSAQGQLENCIDSFSGGVFDSALCSGIGRNAVGIINQFNNRLINLAKLQTEGLDFSLTYQSPDTDAGLFGVTFNANHLLEFSEIETTDTGTIKLERTGLALAGAQELAFPKWRWTSALDWILGEFQARLTERFVGGVDELNTVDLDGNPSRIPSQYYTDIQLSYTPEYLGNEVTLTLGVNNLFDNNPPACFSCGLNAFNANLHDVPGMFGYFRLSWRPGADG